MQRYSGFSLVKHALSHHENWQRHWRNPTPKKRYDVIIVGGGGHGLATAYYLAKEFGVTNVAVIEKGWLGGGNTARNTTIVRSNYLWDEAAQLYNHSLDLWKGLSQDLNYNVMFSQRGVLNLAHTLQDMRDVQRRVNANRLNGIDSEVVTPEQIKEIEPALDISKSARYPIMGASWQKSAGVARHDAVAWGFARGADALGVDLLQNTEVTGFKIRDGQVYGVHTNRGDIEAHTVGCVAAGNSGVLAKMAGLKLPLESHPLQALVSEPAQADSQHRHHVQPRARLRQPVRQGRPGDRRRDRRLPRLRPARQLPHHRAHPAGDRRDVPDVLAGAHEPAVGRHRRYLPRRLPDSVQDPGQGTLFQLRLGHRWLQGHPRLRTRFCSQSG